jgi:hypothetical protein
MSRPLLILCVSWICFIAIADSDAGSGMGLFIVLYGITLVWGLTWLIRFLIHAWRYRRAKPPENRGVAYWLLEPLTLVLAFVIAASGVPRFLRFMASRPALTRYVQSARPSDGDTKHWVGLYAVRETEVLPDGVVRFITSDSGFDEAGFAFAPRSAPPVIGEDIYTKLSFADGWYHWHRSW